MSGIKSLAVENIATIFYWTLIAHFGDHPKTWPGVRQILLNTSRSWRAIAYRSTFMWTHMFIDQNTTVTAVQEWLTLSAAAPIYLNFSFRRDILKWDRTPALDAILPLLAPHVHHCVHVTIQTNWPRVADKLARYLATETWPVLGYIHTTFKHSVHDLTVPVESMPMLTTLEIRPRIHLSRPCFPSYSMLRHLSVKGELARGLQAKDWVTVFGELMSLTSLSLDDMGGRYSEPPPHTTIMPLVTHLRISGFHRSFHRLLGEMQFPALHTLLYSTDSEQEAASFVEYCSHLLRCATSCRLDFNYLHWDSTHPIYDQLEHIRRLDIRDHLFGDFEEFWVGVSADKFIDLQWVLADISQGTGQAQPVVAELGSTGAENKTRPSLAMVLIPEMSCSAFGFETAFFTTVESGYDYHLYATYVDFWEERAP
ncbi:hypothetical protein K438DRAFT_1770517 [Mycena galopus ATCC 62051]|nr:hypothetical protein K438DRAFT_1770517 [Mycena galopus ATCC 62051]